MNQMAKNESNLFCKYNRNMETCYMKQT
jgi:hypothetical protein